jgi:LacI family transcriptional regulator
MQSKTRQRPAPKKAARAPSIPATKKSQTTIGDLARVLGMDKSSVSLALRDNPRMSAATRARVQKAAAEHNYIPNWAAKRLAGSTGHAIGLIMPSEFGCLTDPPVVRTTQALARRAASRGLTLNLIADQELAQTQERAISPLHADGLLIWGDVPAASVQRFSAIYDRPVIVLDPHHPSYAKYSGNAIAIQNREGASALVRHLHERGARHLIFVQAEAEHLSHVARWRGARETWHALASAASLTHLDLAQLGDAELVRLAELDRAAIFCSHDRGAMAVWHRLHRLGVSVPDDVKLAGFDGDEYAELVGLTTAVFDSEALADTAFGAMIELLSGDSARPVVESVPITLRTGTTS